MKSVVKTAKTVEDAINLALAELGVEREDISIEILEEPAKRFFGLMGNKDAKIKVTVTNDPITLSEKFLKEVFEKMNIKADANINRDGQDLFVDIININSVDKGIIIGKRGITLDSLQYLLSLMINKNREKYIRVLIDTENYREKREETLIKLAKKLARTVKTSRRPIRLEPMNPYERRIIHSALQNDSGIVTYSEGEEPFRRIVIQAK
ncbi:protein Jag [Gottschalkia purinilytica]|uniref:RNA-binding protein KhpB n=1 Tax=Gottschalkia purinilytica TaxID=1503 RepID=A0A0L0W6V9_GOTPU|nr:RNA-binding cell elongation regulator Jag/EloR [Gottschalkia purinilytica]KNF07293.1 protein Jag [Gottschalkia purinilytica]